MRVVVDVIAHHHTVSCSAHTNERDPLNLSSSIHPYLCHAVIAAGWFISGCISASC